MFPQSCIRKILVVPCTTTTDHPWQRTCSFVLFFQCGQGNDFPSFKAAFDPAKVQWGAFCCHGIDERNSVESVRNKIVQINWVGESVKPMKRMKALQGASLVTEIISGSVAVSVEATNEEEIDAKEIATKLADCGGAHKPTYYEFGGEGDNKMKLSLKDIGKDVAGDKV
jgi:hypothetical protein